MDESTGPSADPLKVALDAALDQCLASAREGIKDDPATDPYLVVFKQVWGNGQHDQRAQAMIITHMALRLIGKG